MAWFEKEMNFAKDSLAEVSQQAIERAGERLTGVVKDGVSQAGTELREVIERAGEEIDAKLDKISQELHNQRQFTKDDVREMVDYAGDKLSTVLDERVAVAKREISSLVEEKIEYFKEEIDDFFIRRQDDLARERRRMFLNVVIAIMASLMLGAVSWMYHRFMGGSARPVRHLPHHLRLVDWRLSGVSGNFPGAPLAHHERAQEGCHVSHHALLGRIAPGKHIHEPGAAVPGRPAVRSGHLPGCAGPDPRRQGHPGLGARRAAAIAAVGFKGQIVEEAGLRQFIRPGCGLCPPIL